MRGRKSRCGYGLRYDSICVANGGTCRLVSLEGNVCLSVYQYCRKQQVSGQYATVAQFNAKSKWVHAAKTISTPQIDLELPNRKPLRFSVPSLIRQFIARTLYILSNTEVETSISFAFRLAFNAKVSLPVSIAWGPTRRAP